jgi:hypothetical protein
MLPHRHDPNPPAAWAFWCDGVVELVVMNDTAPQAVSQPSLACKLAGLRPRRARWGRSRQKPRVYFV